MRLATENGAHPFGLALWQVSVGAAILVIACLVSGRIRLFNRSHIRHYFVVAMTGSAVPGVLYFAAGQHVPAGILAMTVALVPMLTYLTASLLRLDAWVLRRTFGILFGFAAVYLIIVPRAGLPDPAMIPWVLVALVSALSYTIENLYVDSRVPGNADMLILLTGASVIATLILLPLNLVAGTLLPLAMPWTITEYAIFSLALSNVVAYLMFLKLIKSAGAVFASQVGYLVTLAGVFWGIGLFAERHSIYVWIALVLMLLGIMLVTPRMDELNVSSRETL